MQHKGPANVQTIKIAGIDNFIATYAITIVGIGLTRAKCVGHLNICSEGF